MPEVLLILYPGCAHIEIMPLLSMLEGACKVVAVGPTEEPVCTSEGVRLAVDTTYARAALSDVKLVVVPGGDPEGVLNDVALMGLLRSATVPVAAICNGALLLAQAGLLEGRRVTHTAMEKYAPRPDFDALLEVAAALFARTTYVDEDVVLDGLVVTAKPWAAITFAKQAAQLSGLVTHAHAASRARYLRGVRDASIGDPHQRWAVLLAQTDRQATRDDVEAHVAHLRVLEKRGALELAGPFPEARSGLVVLRVATRSEAESIAAEDPFVQRGVRTAEVRRWILSSEDNNHLQSASR